jgi:outer membrane protein OmpA-like peptidoglycan-associated protein
LPAGAALGEETVYIGGTGEQVEINLDVLEALGTPPNVAGLLRADIRRSQVQNGMPLPLPGEVRQPVTQGPPMPPPSRPAQMTRRLTAAPQPAAAIAPVAPRPPAAALPTARRIAPEPSAPTRTAAVPAPPRVATPAPSAPKVASTPAPTVAAPARVAIPAPTPPAPQASSGTAAKSTASEGPAPPAARTRPAAVAPPPPPAVIAEAPKAPPAAKTPEPATQVASAPAAPKTPAPAASANSAAISVIFETDSQELPGDASSTLGSIAARMKANSELRVQLMAYATSGDRSEAKARRLSLSRALEVRSFLIREGIASTRMDVRALGDRAPGAPGDRVDLTLVER